MFDRNDIVRYITGYSKTPSKYGNFLAEVEYEFSLPVPLSFLQNLFNEDPNDPDEVNRYLIECYELDEKKAEALQPFIKEKLDLDKYYFQLECSDKENYERSKKEGPSKFTESDMVRFISAYPYEEDENDEVIEERYYPQRPLPLEYLRKVFPEDLEENDLVTYRQINAKQAKALQPFFNEMLDTKRSELYLGFITKDIYDAHYKNKI